MRERVATRPGGIGWLDCLSVVTDRELGGPTYRRSFWRRGRAEREARRRNSTRVPNIWGFAHEWRAVQRGGRWAVVAFEIDVVLATR